MSFEKIVTPEGTDKFVPQSYFSTRTKAHSLIEDVQVSTSMPTDWFDLSIEEDQTLLLFEISLETMQAFAQTAATLLQFAKSASVDIVVLMFDGVFHGREHLVDDAIADQIYGIATPSCGPLLCLDRDILLSEHWRSLISHVRSIYIENHCE